MRATRPATSSSFRSPIEARAGALAALGLGLWLAGCAGVAERYDAAARERGLERHDVVGTTFHHAVFQPPAAKAGRILHVYIEGDGTPLIGGRSPTVDPTPRRPLMPALMARDPAPKLLLGRPCYHGLAAMPPCRPTYWTEGRFAETVVSSMTVAIRKLARQGGHKDVVLIGHSGGGVLALLIAQRLRETRAIVAVATVADIDLWTHHHGLAPLSASLNPNASIRPGGVPELFLAGSEDRVTPPELIRRAAGRRPQARLRVYAGFDHACCWARVWPEVVAWIADPK